MPNSGFTREIDALAKSIDYVEVQQLSTVGATCDAFKVRHYGRLLFLKRAKDISDSVIKATFKKEFEIGFNLNHNGIVRYIAFDENACSIFTEWIEGVTLAQFISDNPDYFKTSRNSDRFISQLLAAVEYLHAHSVVHLDLKPENIMITDIDHSVKIIDLGFSVTGSFDRSVGFTQEFAAPELLNGAKVDGRADIYAIGRILEYIYNEIGVKPSIEYRKFISKCTADDSDDRPASIADAQILLSRKPRYTIVAILALIGLAIVGIGLYVANYNSTEIEPQSVDSVQQIVAKDSLSYEHPQESEIVIKEKEIIKTPKQVPNKTRKLTPAEQLDTAEANMGWFVAIRGHYDLKKEWYARQYRKFEELKKEYIKTDTSQRLGTRLNLELPLLIEKEKDSIAQLFPETDMATIKAVGHDVLRVVVYLCLSDPKLYTDPDKISQVFVDCARRKAALLQ